METPQITPAERMYAKHLQNVANYQRRHPEKMREKYHTKMEKVRADPEKYEEWKRQRREYDKTFREKKKQAKEENDASTFSAFLHETCPAHFPPPEPASTPSTPEDLGKVSASTPSIPEVLGVMRVNKRVFSRK